MPLDKTPLGDEMAEPMPERKFPQPKPAHPPAGADDRPDATDISSRPPLPSHPERTAADIEDEEADPVIDAGPGIDDGPQSLRKQKG